MQAVVVCLICMHLRAQKRSKTVKVDLYGESDDPAKMTDTKMAFLSCLPAVARGAKPNLRGCSPFAIMVTAIDQTLYVMYAAAMLLRACQRRGTSDQARTKMPRADGIGPGRFGKAP